MDSSIYSLIEKNTIDDILESFYQCTDIPIYLTDSKGYIIESHGPSCRYCQIMKPYEVDSNSPERIRVKTAKKSLDSKEPYIFSCPANLTHIVYSLKDNGQHVGSIFVGPFILDEPNPSLIENFDKWFGLSSAELIDLYDSLHEVTRVSPTKVNYLNHMVVFLFGNLIEEGKTKLVQSTGKMYQQAQISESVKLLMEDIADPSLNGYPLELERELLIKVRTGNREGSRESLNKLLGFVLFSENNDLQNAKKHGIELCSVLSRAAIEGGANASAILHATNNFFLGLDKIDSIDDLCYSLQETVQTFTDNIFNEMPIKNAGLIKQAIKYISENFARNVTLDEVANEVHLNASYFSTLFKQSTGSSFKEYLNMVRVEEAKRLLSGTDMSIQEISMYIGFDNQSYFAKVFKKVTGVSPKQYR